MIQQAQVRFTGLRRLVWIFVAPLRWYIRGCPIDRGKGFAVRHLLVPLLPRDGETFPVSLNTTGEVRLRFRESLGLVVLLHGSFEAAEIALCESAARPQTTFLDVGANVGIFSIAIAAARPDLAIVAVEPALENYTRLLANLALSAVENVVPLRYAASRGNGSARVHRMRGNDGAFLRAVDVQPGSGPGANEPPDECLVEARPLDDLLAMALPPVSVAKIDVEGGELDVLEGAQQLIATQKPQILVEAATPAALQLLDDWAERHGYRRAQVRNIRPWNHWYIPAP